MKHDTPEDIDISKPPMPPPNRVYVRWPFVGMVQTKASKREQQEYDDYLDRREALR